MGVKLHDTVVVEFRKDGTVRLNTGGWLTVTTKDRINSHLPDGFGHLYSNKGTWYYRKGYVWDKENPSKPVRYFDGLILDRDGNPVNAEPEAEQEKRAKADARLRKEINKFIRAFRELAERKGLQAPGAGDCFFCQNRVTHAVTGAPVETVDHLESHIAETYLVPSLLYNALVERNGGDEHRAGMQYQGAMHGMGFIVETALRAYFKKRAHLMSYERVLNVRKERA
jgi:hypothetical protein